MMQYVNYQINLTFAFQIEYYPLFFKLNIEL